MSRPLRIEYPDAWYHVMNRGRRAEKIFVDQDDYKMFLNLLQETVQMWNINATAYCLMPNHYHILVKTPEANISRSMRHLNGVYTQRFNRRHSTDGPLFKGRYKSILIGADNYLLQLVRYIHKNPVKAGLVEAPQSYLWSSHKGYLSVSKKWDWLYKRFILSLLTPRKEDWIKEFKRFMLLEDKDEASRVVDSKKWPSMLGPTDFIDWIKGKYYSKREDEDVPDSKALLPEKDKILRAVCRFYHVDKEELIKSRRGVFNEPRNVAIYIIRQLRRDRLRLICEQFQMEKYSSVSSVIERMKARMKQETKLRNRIRAITESIIKSQEQT